MLVNHDIESPNSASGLSPGEPPGKKFKRTYVACLNCRVRKVKCDLGDTMLPTEKCRRCARERRDCIFADLKKRTVVKMRPQKTSDLPSPQATEAKDEDHHKNGAPKHFSTMEGALTFLANAAGKIATADERDKIDARTQHEQLESRNSDKEMEKNYSTDSLDRNVVNRHLSNASLATAGSGLSSGDSTPQREIPPLSLLQPYLNRPFNKNTRLEMPPVENAEMVRPKGTGDLADIVYIGDSENDILTVAQAEYLIRYFFTTMHPFFPHIPRFLHLPQVLSGYPILLCAILTISSRYHSLEESTPEGVAKNIAIHDILWLRVQQLISQTVWAEASTRSIGTVFAFLLFTEWNPRAIHWRWSDYANKADDSAESRAPPAENANATDEPAGLGAMRRSNRMAWMLIGSAVRLAQDTGFMELNSKTFLATHIAEINSVMNMSRRSMLGHSLAEVDLDHEAISEDDMELGEEKEYTVLNMSEEDQRRLQAEYALRFTTAQKAQIELLQIMSLGHESLYGFKAQLGSLSQRQNLSVLNIMSPMINNWGRKYSRFLESSSSKLARKISLESLVDSHSKMAQELAACLESESFIFEFNYAKLYIYSLALSPSPKTRKNFQDGKLTLKLDEISKSAKYIEQAFNSANEILLVAHRVHKLKMLRFMPVRWVTRIVRAVAFIVKCYLTITAHKETDQNGGSSVDNFDSTILSLSLISVESIVQSIQKAAITLRECSPDELHLCTRYSNVLMYLCSEMKTKLKSHNQEDTENVAKKSEYDSAYTQDTYQEYNNPSFLREDRAVMDAFDNAGLSSESAAAQSFLGDSEVMDWFMSNRNIGLDFVAPWTELIEQQLEDQQFNFNDGLT